MCYPSAHTHIHFVVTFLLSSAIHKIELEIELTQHHEIKLAKVL